MHKEPLFLTPAFQERIWGGNKLKTMFDYPIPSNETGEAWVISAHENGPSLVKSGDLTGQTLTEVWENHPEYFNTEHTHEKSYPLLVKILDANKDLSVQVHPDDTYANEVEGVPYGKTECWYVLEADPGAEIVFGHHAASQEAFRELATNGKWDQLLRYVPVKKGDFIYVPSGSIHAIGAGIVILETQQSSDVTYRVYDYDRKDAAGNTRELHLDKSIDVTTAPHQNPKLNEVQTQIGDLLIKQLVKEKYFTVSEWTLDGIANLHQDHDFLQVSVIDGRATLTVGDTMYTIEKGTHFILPYQIGDYQLEGKATFIVSHT